MLLFHYESAICKMSVKISEFFQLRLVFYLGFGEWYMSIFRQN